MVMAASDYDDDVDLPSPQMKHDVLHRLRVYRVPGLQVKPNFVFEIFKRGSCFFNVFVHKFFLHGWAGTLTMAKSLWRECWSMMPSLLSTDIEVIYILEPWQWHPRLRTNVQSRSFWQQASTQSICDDWIKIAPAALICMSWSKSSDIVGVLHKCHAFFSWKFRYTSSNSKGSPTSAITLPFWCLIQFAGTCVSNSWSIWHVPQTIFNHSIHTGKEFIDISSCSAKVQTGYHHLVFGSAGDTGETMSKTWWTSLTNILQNNDD